MISNEAIFALSLLGKTVSIKQLDGQWLHHRDVDQVCEDAHSDKWLVSVQGINGWFELEQVKIVTWIR